MQRFIDPAWRRHAWLFLIGGECAQNLPCFGSTRLPQSSSASRFTAGAAGFLNLSQCRVRPLTYGEPSRFDTMPPLEGAMAGRLPKCQP
jgi:hypothetical protein